MSRKLHTKAGAAVYAARKGIVEPVFGQIKQARGFRQFLLRGFEKVQANGRWCARRTTFSSCIASACDRTGDRALGASARSEPVGSCTGEGQWYHHRHSGRAARGNSDDHDDYSVGLLARLSVASYN